MIADTPTYIGAGKDGLVLVIEGPAAVQMRPDVARLIGREMALLSQFFACPDPCRIDNIVIVHHGTTIRLRDCLTGGEIHVPRGLAADYGRALMQFALVAERLTAH